MNAHNIFISALPFEPRSHGLPHHPKDIEANRFSYIVLFCSDVISRLNTVLVTSGDEEVVLFFYLSVSFAGLAYVR